MLYFVVIACAGLVAAVTCHPRTVGAGAVAGDQLDNYIEQPLDQKVRYHYAYGVDDAPSGVFSHKWEERLGNYVKGAYSMMEADGRIRTVDYEVDGPKGFHAVVRTTLPGTSFLSTQQLRQSRDSNPNPPVNVLTNHLPTRPVLEPRTPRLIHKDLPPNFHSVKPDYFWGSAPGGHAAKQHRQDGAHGRQQNGGQRDRIQDGGQRGGRAGGTHSSYRTPDVGEHDGLHDSNGHLNFEGYVEHGQEASPILRTGNGRNVATSDRGKVSGGRGQNGRSRFSSNHRVRDVDEDNVLSSSQFKSRREGGNFLGGGGDDLAGVMVPPRRTAEVGNYDHLLRAGRITDVRYL